MAFVSSLCQTKTKGILECSSQRLCGLVVLSKFVQSSKPKKIKNKKKKSKRKKKKKKTKKKSQNLCGLPNYKTTLNK